MGYFTAKWLFLCCWQFYSQMAIYGSWHCQAYVINNDDVLWKYFWLFLAFFIWWPCSKWSKDFSTIDKKSSCEVSCRRYFTPAAAAAASLISKCTLECTIEVLCLKAGGSFMLVYKEASSNNPRFSLHWPWTRSISLLTLAKLTFSCSQQLQMLRDSLYPLEIRVVPNADCISRTFECSSKLG